MSEENIKPEVVITYPATSNIESFDTADIEDTYDFEFYIGKDISGVRIGDTDVLYMSTESFIEAVLALLKAGIKLGYVDAETIREHLELSP